MNKKLTKLLSVFIMAGIIGGGAVGMVGCKNKDKGDEGTQQEQPGDTTAKVTKVTITSANTVVAGKTLDLTATVTGENLTAADKGVNWTVTGTAATLSGSTLTGVTAGGTVTVRATSQKDSSKYAEITITVTESGSQGGGEDNPNPPTPVKAENVEVNISDLAASENYNGALGGDKSGITVAGTEAVIEANSKKAFYKGEEVSCANRLKLNKLSVTEGVVSGKGYLKVTPVANAKLIVYAISGSSSAGPRNLALYGTDGTIKDGTMQSIGDGKNNLLIPYVQDLTANTEYLVASPDSGVNVYYVALIYDGFEETIVDDTHATAVEADCEVEGHVAYVKTNYGRYFTDSTMTTGVYNSEDIIKPALGHQYADANVAIGTAPTGTTTGTATVTCGRHADDATHTATIELPELTNSAWTRTTEPDSEGNYTYTYTDSETKVVVTVKSTEQIEAKQINADTVLLYMDTEKNTHIVVYDKDTGTWVEDKGIISSAEYYKTNEGNGASLFQPNSVNYAQTYDNGTTDNTADDFAVPSAVKFESATKLKFTTTKTLASMTVYYTYKAADAAQTSMSIDGQSIPTTIPTPADPADAFEANDLLSATLTYEFEPFTYELSRGTKEIEVAFVVLKVKATA